MEGKHNFPGRAHTDNARANSANSVIRLFGERVRTTTGLRVALIGSYAPRSCGIATFTTDLREKLATWFPEIQVDIYAVDASGSTLDYGRDVRIIRAERRASYRSAARAINQSGADLVWVQHEFGIYGGDDGAFVGELVDGVAAPVITTFHTVLAEPTAGQHAVMEHLVSRCSRIMVMSRHGRDLMVSRYRAPKDSVEIIEHGAPDRPFVPSGPAKQRIGLPDRKVLTTFGLLGPGKGLDHVIAAMPAILERHPDAVYRILGATHPVLLARDGEKYRDGLMAQARALGVADHIIWDNRFLDIDALLEQLEACDIYITPYPNLEQSTSGTLSYAVALGKAVVSTPYVHARELLSDGVGSLIEPNSPDAIARAVNTLLDDPGVLLATQRRAYERGRRTIWPHFARASAQLITSTVAPQARPASLADTPGLGAVWRMSDATGMFQHSIGVIPDRRHGYCLDDNARALMLMNVVPGLNDEERLRWSTTYAAFVQFAWNPDQRRFRNFMRFDRTWCEDVGSEDSNGRALWALGHTIEHNPDADIRAWALDLFGQVADAMEALKSPRTMAFATLGALCVLRTDMAHPTARQIVVKCCDALARLIDRQRRPDWAWFEAVLAYDNPRLCQALIEGGVMLERKTWLAAGLETLAWINACQTGVRGHFRPIGSESFGRSGEWMPFDQQPLEAQAAIEAAASAWQATREQRWADHAIMAYQWFFGANDRGVVMADIVSGRCRDGITPRGRNENSGAESILAFQLGHVGMARLMRAATPRESCGEPSEPFIAQPSSPMVGRPLALAPIIQGSAGHVPA